MLVWFKSLVFFFTAVVYTLVEYFYSIIKNDNKYITEQTKNALYNGLVLIFTETTSVLIFLYITKKLYVTLWGNIPSTTLTQIVVAVVIIDAAYYFYHRVHHGNAKLFTIHSIHHVGTKYNLALALMLPWIGQASIYILLVPLIFLHISPYTIISAYFFVLTYQFFCHITYLQLPKWCDLFLVTPRNHRVHHYHDRYSQTHNFGAVFSIWDRIFSTYTDGKKEKRMEVFGIEGTIPKNFFEMEKETVIQFFRK
jgi:sterol desaturase/sphingolipid hydroxylase (fatty acid hydroxylase superfamily)